MMSPTRISSFGWITRHDLPEHYNQLNKRIDRPAAAVVLVEPINELIDGPRTGGRYLGGLSRITNFGRAFGTRAKK
jgi:hypothetical protein